MTHEEFSKLRQHIGGLFSFNSFISTSTDKLLSLAFAYGTLGNPDMTAIFFEMEIDPSIQSSPFASIESLSYFPAEHEMLFSMHSVFRIEDVKQIQDGIWQVNLRLTSDDDEQLRRLYQFIHKEMRNIEGVERLAKLMSEMGEWEKATKIYEALIRTTNDDDKKKLAHLHGQLGFICNEQSDWHQALFHGEKALELYLTFLPPDHPQIATIYTNIGFTLREKGELESSLNYHYRGLDIKRKALEPDKQEIAISYGNIGEVLRKQGRLDEALTSFQQCLTNELECLPTTHPSLAFTYSSIGLTYNDKGDHTNALSQYEQCLMIQKKSLPPNHPFVAATYANMAKACQSLHRYDDALQYAEKAVSIASHNFSPDHPELVHYQAMLDKIHHKL
jgi:tetratricopeptide (TPR) repeat protein